jgi:perosamine synthetase
VILPVHLFGAAAKMDDLMKIADEHEISVLEDCAQAHGTEYGGRKVGGIGAAGAFSFFATKHMTTGEGGIITTDDPQIAETGKTIRNHGLSGRDDHLRLGFNNRMTEIEAAMGLVQLKKLDGLNSKRIENSQYLLDRVRELPWARVPVASKDVKHTYFWCPLMVREDSGKTIDDLKKHLKDHNVGFRQRYREPLYRQPVLKRMGLDYSGLHLPNVERVAGQVIGLPNHAGLSQEEVEYILKILRQF